MKTTALTSRLVKIGLGTVLVLFLAIIYYSETSCALENAADNSDKMLQHTFSKSKKSILSDTYLAKADSTNDYINIIGMTCAHQEIECEASWADEGKYEEMDVSKKTMTTVYLADNKNILNISLEESALSPDDPYLTYII